MAARQSGRGHTMTLNQNLTISVVMPALNEAANIGRTLAPLQALRQVGHQIILVDGGSTDGTRELAAPLVDTVIRSEPGRARQMNEGAAHATGDLLWFLHADTQVPASAATELMQLARVPHQPASQEDQAGGSQQPDHLSDFWGHFRVSIEDPAWPFRLIEWSMNLRTRLTSVVTGDQGLFVSCSLWEKTGGYRMMPLMEDVEISKRLRRYGNALHLESQLVTSARRWRSGGIVKTIMLMWWLRLAYVAGVSPDRLAAWYRPQAGRE